MLSILYSGSRGSPLADINEAKGFFSQFRVGKACELVTRMDKATSLLHFCLWEQVPFVFLSYPKSSGICVVWAIP